MERKKIISIDFDGVIHRYSKGWQGGELYDPIVPGFFDWAARMRATGKFKLVVFSSRSADGHARYLMGSYLQKELFAWRNTFKVELAPELYLEDFEFVATKPPAFASIDDRGFQFNGDWNAPELQPDALDAFQTWTQRQ